MTEKKPLKLTHVLLAVAAVILVATALALCYLSSAASPAGQSYTLKASVNEDCTGTPWFVGEEKGLFSQYGLTFVDVGQTVTEQRTTALALGQIDVLDADPLMLAELIKSGVRVRAVAQSGASATDGDLNKEYLHWLVLNNSSLQNFSSIGAGDRKITVGIAALGTSPELQTNALLEKAGVPESKVEYVIIPDQNQQQALRQGLIDIAVLHSAFYACAEARGGVRIVATSTDALGPAGGTTLLICRESFIEEHPDTVRKFIQGYKASERWCNANRAEAGNITAERLGLCTGVSHYYSESGEVSEAELQVWLDEMVAQGIIKPGELKPTDLYTDEFSDIW